MTAGEQQAQHIVVDGPGSEIFRNRLVRLQLRVIAPRRLVAADLIDAAPMADIDKPGGGVLRDAVPGPLPQGSDEGLLQAFLRQAEIIEQSDQRRQHAAGMVPVDLLDGTGISEFAHVGHPMVVIQYGNAWAPVHLVDDHVISAAKNSTLRRGGVYTAYRDYMNPVRPNGM